MSNPSKIKSEPYRNWVRGALGLVYLQKGLYPFTDRVVKAEHARIVQNLMPCTSCAIDNILPDHASGNVCIQKNKARCNCRKKVNRNCATCSKIYDDIVIRHRFREPNWVTGCSTWYNDYWQFAKCFLKSTSKGTNNTAEKTDVAGLLSIIINGLFFQSEIQCNIHPPNDSFSQVLQIRNEIVHNSTLELTDQDVARYLQSMIAVLEDKKTLSLDPAAQAASIKLKEILNDELNIARYEEGRAIQTAVDDIGVAKKQAEEGIRKLEEKQNASKAPEETIRKLREEKQNAIKPSEEIKEYKEVSRNALQQQTSESITKIKTTKEQAIKMSRLQFPQCLRKQTEIERFELGNDGHENTIRALEEELQNLRMKQEKLDDYEGEELTIQKFTEEQEDVPEASNDNVGYQGTESSSDAMEYYPTNNETGLLILLNRKDTREGHEMDTDRLKGFFGKKLKFHAIDAYDSECFKFNKEHIEKFLGKVIRYINSERNKYYCIVFFIGSHGNEHGILTEKTEETGELLKVEEIRKRFSNEAFPTMAGRPKIFLIQVCRGPGIEGSVLQNDSSSEPKPEKRTANHDADSLLLFSTTHGKQSWRNPKEGSILIQECKSTFDKNWETDHLEEMLITVRSRISRWSGEDKGKECRQTTEMCTTLTKRLKFEKYLPAI